MPRTPRSAPAPAPASVPPPVPAAVPAPGAAGLRVLLVDDGARRIGLIRDELHAQGCVVVGVVDSAVAIHDCVERLQPDLVIVDAESPSRDTLENLALASSRHPRPVVVFSEDAGDAPLQAALQAGVSAYVIAGLQRERLLPVLKVAIARFEQERALRAQLAEAREQLSGRALLDRAKALLGREFGLSEEQAHAHLRRMAMDRGQRLAQVAERLLSVQELLHPRA